MARNVAARRQPGWKVIYTLPDVCLTPLGSSVMPVPYLVYADLTQSVRVAESVKANGYPVVIYDETVASETIGDKAGVRKGIESKTVEANCWPKTHSSTVWAEKHYFVRHDDKFWMNGKKGGSGTWRVAEVLKILCPKDKNVVDDLAHTDVEIADEIYYDDPYYDGTQWITRRFDGAGSWDSGTSKLRVLTSGSAQSAAYTIYHELIHKNQSPGMSWQEKEIDAYYQTEQWAIMRGLPGDPDFRNSGDSGTRLPDRAAIADFVKREYPLPTNSMGPIPVGHTNSGDTILSDGTTRAPQIGDSYAGAEQVKNLRKIPRSVWKCP
jgi:hypothetical protein